MVLNHLAAAAIPKAGVGSTVTLAVDGELRTWRIVGIVRDLGSPATVYIPSTLFDRISRTPGRTQLLAVATTTRETAQRADTIRRVEHAFDEAGMGIGLSVPVTLLKSAVSGHMAVLLNLILTLSALMSLVGVLGLMAAMSVAVLERTRELGVLQAVGATPGMVLRVILSEGILVGALSSLVAVILSVPLSLIVGAILGILSFCTGLPLVMSPFAILAWVGIVLVFSVAATALPAWRASRITVREALAYN